MNASRRAAGLLSLAAMTAAACAGDAAVSSPTLQVDTVGSVVHIRHGPPTVTDTLEATTTIGRTMAAEAGAADEFGRIVSVVLDPDGKIFVAEGQAQEIRVFEPTGQFVRAFGRSGSGPGEFLALYSLAVLGDTLLAMDSGNARISLLTRTGEPIGTWPWYPLTGPGNFVRFYPTGPGEVYTLGLRSGPGARPATHIRLTHEGPADTLSHPTPENLPSTTLVCPASGSISFHTIPFAGRRIAVPAPDGQLASAWSTDYRIALTTPAGDTVRVIEREYEPLPISDAQWEEGTQEYREFRDRMPGARCTPEEMTRPAHQAALQGIYFDERGRMVVEVTADGMVRYDFYDRDGTAAGTTYVPARDVAVVPYFRGRTIVQVGRDELDTQRVQLFERREPAGADEVRSGRTPARLPVSLPAVRF